MFSLIEEMGHIYIFHLSEEPLYRLTLLPATTLNPKYYPLYLEPTLDPNSLLGFLRTAQWDIEGQVFRVWVPSLCDTVAYSLSVDCM